MHGPDARLQPLTVASEAFTDLKTVESGDCLVTFSRTKVHELKKEIEKTANKRVCVIYGGLPPEARSRQAELFNNRDITGYDVLIASDAIGMVGRRVIHRIVYRCE